MPDVEGKTTHDADSHVMELRGAIIPYVEARHREEFAQKAAKKNTLVERSAQALHDHPALRAAE